MYTGQESEMKRPLFPPEAKSPQIEQLCKILVDEEDTCWQLAECAKEQQLALRQGDGPGFVRASLTQAHLARRLFFLEEERNRAIENLVSAFSDTSNANHLVSILERLPETDAEKLTKHARKLEDSANRVATVHRVNSQMIQTNIQLAAALAKSVNSSASQSYGSRSPQSTLLASKLDERV
jgi:hypothetical protein